MQRREQWDFGRSLRFGPRPQLDGLTQVWQAQQSTGAAGPVKKESDSGTGGEGAIAVLARGREGGRASGRVGE